MVVLSVVRRPVVISSFRGRRAAKSSCSRCAEVQRGRWVWCCCDVKAAPETPKAGTKPSAATEVLMPPFMAREEHFYSSRGGLWRVWTWLVGSEMGVTHGLPFECATSISIGVLGMCLYIPWLDV